MIETDREIAKTHEHVATMNAQAAVMKVSQVETSLTDRLTHLEALMVNQQGELDQLQRKYNLLLTKNFSGGSTS